ncbi:MAG: serpin family protein [Actinobacteria bacterium]|nr:serpin family protein [Actinomycetota bacterium]
MLSASAERGEIELFLADRIWPDATSSPDQGWVDLLAAEHGASSQVLDLRGDPDRSAEIINEWVSDQTEGLIEDLIDPSGLGGSTVLVLTDAIYFEAKWERPFGKYGEVAALFERADGTSVETSYMVERELADLRGSGDGWVAAEIPYRGSDYSMLVVVPDEGRFDEMRDQLALTLITEVDQQMTTGPYQLRLPKWDNKSDIDLLPWLEAIGVAPGSYPLISPPAFLGGAVHAANIAVDETGTIAAAATGLVFGESGPAEPELDVFADQPFLYLIRHRPTGVVLFAGQVMDPTA